MLRSFKKYYFKQMFEPNLISVFINPFYISRKLLFKSIQKKANLITGDLLDIGCGTKPYERLFNVKKYDGLELDNEFGRKNKKADFFYNGIEFPFKNESYDSIICNQVLEHVFNPDLFLQEISRVLKDGGRALITVPFVWDEHEQPNDFARYTSFGVKHLLKENGLEVIEQEKTGNAVLVIFQLVLELIYKSTHSNNPFTNLLSSILYSGPLNILAVFFNLLPSNKDLYLDNVVIAKKVKN